MSGVRRASIDQEDRVTRMSPTPFDGMRVVTLESRQAGPIAELIARQGGVPVAAPAPREGATVTRVPVYRWALPEDTGPLRSAIEEIAGGRIGAVLFTSAQQAVHMLDVAAEMGREADLRAAMADRTVVGSIGPTTTETLRE